MNLIFTLALSLLAPQTFADDLFFHKDQTHFIADDLVSIAGKPYVKLAACEVQQDRASAQCKDLALIETGEFEDMRGCERWKIAKDGALALGGATLTTSLLAGSMMSGGSISELAWLAVMAGGFGATEGWTNAKEAYQKYLIFSKENETDQDWITALTSYDRFIELLSASLSAKNGSESCNIAGHTFPASPAVRTIRLTLAQVQMLSHI